MPTPIVTTAARAEAPGVESPSATEAMSVVQHLLTLIHADHPTWTGDVLLAQLSTHQSTWLDALIRQVGFSLSTNGVGVDQALVVGLHAKGVWSDTIIADETGLPLERVRAILAELGGYGAGAYGLSSYGGRHRHVSEDGSTVVRRVSIMGQMSYRNHTYSLGIPYRGRVATVQEQGPVLIASFCDRPVLRLASRHYLPPQKSGRW